MNISGAKDFRTLAFCPGVSPIYRQTTIIIPTSKSKFLAGCQALSVGVSLNTICENIPNIEVCIERAYSTLVF